MTLKVEDLIKKSSELHIENHEVSKIPFYRNYDWIKAEPRETSSKYEILFYNS